MVIFVILGFSLLGLLIDRYIYVNDIRDSRVPRWLKITFNAVSIAINVGTFVAMLLFNTILNEFRSEGSIVLLWVVYIFLLNLEPRIVFVLFSLIRRLAARLAGRKVMIIEYIGWVVSIVVFISMLWGMAVSRHHLRVENVTIESENLPEQFDGYRIVMFSDTHLGNLGHNNSLIERMVTRVNSFDPDMIINGGDFVHIRHEEFGEKYMSQMAPLHARDGIFTVLGNHDLGYYITDSISESPYENTKILIDKERAMGWDMLLNENRWIHRGGDSIAVAGVKYPIQSKKSQMQTPFHGSDVVAAFEGIPDSAFSILITHTPEVFDSIPQAGVNPDLTVAGHIHAMQVKVNIGKWHWSPARFIYPKWSGLYKTGDNYLYINDGIGYVAFPMRIGCAPEITVFELKRPSKN